MKQLGPSTEFTLHYAWHTLLRGVAVTLTANVLAISLGFVLHLLLARTLAVEEYGLFALLVAWLWVLAQICTLGFQQPLLRFVSLYLRTRQLSRLFALLRFVEVRCLCLATVTSIVGTILLRFLGSNYDEETGDAFLYALWCIPILTLLMLRSSALRGLGNIKTPNFADQPLRHSVVIIGVLIISYFTKIVLSVADALLLFGGGFLLGLFYISVTQKKILTAITTDTQRNYEKQTWWKAGRSFYILLILQLLLSHVDLLFLGWLSTSESVAAYSVAWRIAILTTVPLTAMNFVLAPMVSAFSAGHDRRGMQTVVTLSTWITFGVTAILFCVLFAVSEDVLQIFGGFYPIAVPTLRVLLFGNLVSAACGSVILILNMSGHERSSLLATIVSGVVYILCSPFLILAYDVLGAALSRTFAVTVLTFSGSYFLWKNVGVIPGIIRFRW